jgi:hypothetical protein
MIGMLDYAKDIANNRENTTLNCVWFALRDFVCSAEGTSPACGAARGYFLRERSADLSPDCHRTAFDAMKYDILNFSLGRWDGSLFGGRNADPEGPFEEALWWTCRERLLSGGQ